MCMGCFVYNTQKKEKKQDLILQLLESDVRDTTEQHIQNMEEVYQLTNTHILYLEGKKSHKTKLCYVDRRGRDETILVENVKCFVELDGKIYYTKLDKKNEIDGGIYCYDISSGRNKTIVPGKRSVQWFSLYNNSLVFVYGDGIGLFDLKEQKLIRISDYFPGLPFNAVLMSEYLMFIQETGDVELFSIKEKDCQMIMERDAMSLDTVACIGDDLYIGMNAYIIGGNFNIKKLDKNWNGLWRFSLSDWEKKNPNAMCKISDKTVQKLYVFNNKLYNENYEMILTQGGYNSP